MAESDEEMFADLEKTLCEGLTTLRFEKSVDIADSEIDLSCLENVKDLSKLNGPAVRTYNLYKAFKAFQNNQYLDSIYFETFAMSLFMRIKFHANKIMEGEHHMPTEDNLANLLEQKHEEQPEIIEYLDRFLYDKLPLTTNRLKTIEFENGTELMGLCRQLPNEWTVIQLCKAVNPEVFRQSRDELLRHPGIIFITLICYPMSERFDHRPIKIALNQKDLQELYESAHDLTTNLNANSHDQISKISEKEFNETIVSKLKKLLGPWIVCFSGKSISSSDDTEVIDKLDLFLAQSQHQFSKRQQMLMCLIVRRIYMLTKENVKDAALFISKTKYEYWDLWDFFEDLKLTSKKSSPNSYPVILVVDEHIDFMFWEMCNVHQEFTRVDSMALLLKLFFLHQDNISEGYFNVKGKKASAVIDPDRTLPGFVGTMRPFMKILPTVSCNFLVDKEPEFTDLKSMLGHSDVYVYCGHGSGVQFISSYETCQLSTNAVVFLMGCSSVAFHSRCGYSLATAAHHYYHIAKSPAVIGHLTLTYVSYGAMLLSIMLGKSFANVTQLSDDIWEAHNHRLGRVLKENLTGTKGGTALIKYSPHLSNVISQIRQRCSIPICFRAILCHRGLPVRMD
ncbi:separin-like [Bradysia coprophila]|uniref:separin-like n=1 Tax=Bradysia coprophila TaxID=38358 RepID=UPI00187DB917|nr:separin-like [Bradysia coprophila]